MDETPLPPSVAVHPELTDERLQLVAQVIVQARRDKLAFRQPPDTDWNLSCDCFAWAWHRLREASAEHPWLHITGAAGDLDAEMRIGGLYGVPARFYRPDVPGQPKRTSEPTNSERAAMTAQPLLGDVFRSPAVATVLQAGKDLKEGVVRLRVDVMESLDAKAVTLEVFCDGEVAYTWPIIDDGGMALPFTEPKPGGVVLPPPSAELPEEVAAREAAEEAARRARLLGPSGQPGA